MARSAGPTRFFTPAEANRLLPRIRALFREMDGLVARGQEAREGVVDLEAIWGEEILQADHPGHAKYEGLQEELERGLRGVDERVRQIHDLGGHLKSYEAGLVDFYARRGGRTVFLCWQQGEPAVGFYHDLETGFAGRKPLATEGEAP